MLRTHLLAAVCLLLACETPRPRNAGTRRNDGDDAAAPTVTVSDADVPEAAPNTPADASTLAPEGHDAAVVDEPALAGCVDVPPGAREGDPYRRLRTTTDLPDDTPDAYQIHVLYVEPSDRSASPRLDEDGSIRRSVAAFNGWFRARMGGSSLRMDTCGGVLDVTHVKLPAQFSERAMAQGDTLLPSGTDFVRDRLEAELRGTFADPKKLYLVYYEGLSFGHCGGAPYPPLLLGRFPAMLLGGLFSATYVTAEAAQGATTLTVYDPRQAGLPSGGYAAHLGREPVRVQAVTGATVTLAAPLTEAHASGEILIADERPTDCRDNPLSADGVSLGYMDYSAVHEILHALGIVGSHARYFASEVAPGHLTEASAGGTADVMYQGALPGQCGGAIHASPEASPCVLDPAHENYVMLNDADAGVDLARSVFLEPTPEGAEVPVGFE